jgi:hypothetical protein
MANATTLISIDEYLKSSYRPDCDFVDGELVERNVGELDHNRLQIVLGAWFLAHEESGKFSSFLSSVLASLNREFGFRTFACSEPMPHATR